MNTETKFTPGPWGLTDQGHIYASENKAIISFPTGAFLDMDEGLASLQCDANARLMAASPELLNFVQAVASMGVIAHDEFKERFGFRKSQIELVACELIEKATGEQLNAEDPDAATPFFPQLSPASGDASGNPAVAKCVPAMDSTTLPGCMNPMAAAGSAGEEVVS